MREQDINSKHIKNIKPIKTFKSKPYKEKPLYFSSLMQTSCYSNLITLQNPTPWNKYWTSVNTSQSNRINLFKFILLRYPVEVKLLTKTLTLQNSTLSYWLSILPYKKTPCYSAPTLSLPHSKKEYCWWVK